MKNLFSATVIHDSIKIHLKIDTFLTISSIFLSISLSISVISSCINKFDCTEFLPTISYLASHPFYDRWIIFSITCFVFPLLLFFTAAFTQYRKFMNKCDSYTLLIISILISILLPSIVAIDEVSSSFYLPLDKLHVIILSIIISFTCIWMIFSIEWLFKMYKTTSDIKIKYVVIYIIICFMSLFDSYNQWKISDTSDKYTILAIKEYITILLFLFLPRVYCLVIENTSISLDRLKAIPRD